MSRPRAAAPPQFNSQLQQDDLVDPAAQLLQHSSSSAFAAAVPAGVLSAGDAAALSPAAEQRGSTGSAASVTASSSLGGALLSKRNGIAQTSSRDLATAGSGEVWSVYSSNAMPLGEHPNLATAGGPGSAPLGVLQLTLQVSSQCRCYHVCSTGYRQQQQQQQALVNYVLTRRLFVLLGVWLKHHLKW